MPTLNPTTTTTNQPITWTFPVYTFHVESIFLFTFLLFLLLGIAVFGLHNILIQIALALEWFGWVLRQASKAVDQMQRESNQRWKRIKVGRQSKPPAPTRIHDEVIVQWDPDTNQYPVYAAPLIRYMRAFDRLFSRPKG